ncbi:hypothetical protein I302_105361 [Kwoniella bestiolae CBS 10118]|uniref:Uncharacterized protein n=1 Tax=Kwoniella bestiolae CBS 10118 TaxID=1296100 RepID=A0A1B9FSX3_9TREE|nr:hypothetical protein I302_08644 [Kwoniella bestiolae CBS 10118]OCF21865.1 hypothetical protein I302_08644 [Kwoniella bestiolae CBS 10118]
MPSIRTFTRWLKNPTREPSIDTNRRESNIAVDLPNKPAAELPDHIWLDILKLVRRPTGQILRDQCSVSGQVDDGHGLSDWSRYHQNDLAALMRVSKQLHHLASPLLYDRIIVCDPYRLFYGIDRTPSPDTRSSKLDCLGQVRSMVLIYCKPSKQHPSPTPSFQQFNWSRLPIYQTPKDPDDQNFLQVYLTALESIHHTNQLLETIQQPKFPLSKASRGDTMIFRNIERLIIGIADFKMRNRGWMLDEPSPRNLKNGHAEDQIVKDLLKRRNEISLEFASNLRYHTSKARKACFHSNFGPWTCIPMAKHQSDTTDITAFLDHSISHHPKSIHIVPFTTNHWIITKDLIKGCFVNTDSSWLMDWIDDALPILLHHLCRIIDESLSNFPKRQHSGKLRSTELNIVLPLGMAPLRTAAISIKTAAGQTGFSMPPARLMSIQDKEQVYAIIGERLMPKNTGYYQQRGFSLKVKQAEEGVPMDVDVRPDPVECRCCGLIELV